MNTNWEAIQQDLMQIIEEVKISHSKTTSELSSLTSLVEKTFDLVVELRFKVHGQIASLIFISHVFFYLGWD